MPVTPTEAASNTHVPSDDDEEVPELEDPTINVSQALNNAAPPPPPPVGAAAARAVRPQDNVAAIAVLVAALIAAFYPSWAGQLGHDQPRPLERCLTAAALAALAAAASVASPKCTPIVLSIISPA